MEPLSARTRATAPAAHLWAAGLWSVLTALLGRHAGIGAGAVLAAAGILVCLWRRRAGASCHRELQRRILQLWPGERGAFSCTLALGSGPEVAPDLIAAHRATGLSHLLAVSGAHASMLALLLGVLPGLLGPRRNRLH